MWKTDGQTSSIHKPELIWTPANNRITLSFLSQGPMVNTELQSNSLRFVWERLMLSGFQKPLEPVHKVGGRPVKHTPQGFWKVNNLNCMFLEFHDEIRQNYKRRQNFRIKVTFVTIRLRASFIIKKWQSNVHKTITGLILTQLKSTLSRLLLALYCCYNILTTLSHVYPLPKGLDQHRSVLLNTESR